MAGGPSVFVANKLLDKSLKGTDFTPPSTFYVALFATPSETHLRGNSLAQASELADINAYARKALAASDIVAAANGQASINVDISFPAATGSWATAYQAALMDALTIGTGNIWYFGPLASASTMQYGDVLKIPAGTFLINL